MRVFLPCLFALLTCFAPALRAQSSSDALALDHLRRQFVKLGLTAQDVAELEVLDSYASPSGAEHVYVGQLLRGIPVFNAQAALHFKAGELVYRTSGLQSKLNERASGLAPALTAEAAFGLNHSLSTDRLTESKLVYYPQSGSEVIKLAWQLIVEHELEGKYDLLLADAITGQELYRTSITLSCNFGPHPISGAHAGAKKLVEATKSLDSGSGDGAFYNVIPFGIESPLYGDRQLLFEPADSLASPYGWHDTNAQEGPEFTITRGNNTYTYRDADARANRPDSGFVADGGAMLDFDFPYDPFLSPDTILRASLTQLFYTTNMVHDWTYNHGFDEAAGNFQENNYGRGGERSDAVLAEAQDGSGDNNANFTTFSDGTPGRMQMFLWSSNSLLSVNEPNDLSGVRLTGPAQFGAAIGTVPLSGQVALARDASSVPHLACGPLVDPAAMSGKIAMITRGDCFFQQKAFNAEQAGAIAVIICNPENQIITMAELDEPNDFPVTIPTVMLREVDCIPLRQVITAGDTVTVTLRDNNKSPLDGSFDNGVVTHEYAHGISNRLVGGPSNAFCLTNDEQMGEGWSDFFTLASTPLSKSGLADGALPRGIGNFITSASPDAVGIRSRHYSTDRSINNLTYDHIITAAIPHGVGEAWASVLWDIYWRMVDQYGFDEDLINGDGGNNAAVRLVIEGMKYTACNPGILDARDGLIVADILEFGGANSCMLWEVFRQRGMGATATQGSSASRGDNRERFDMVPECIKSIKIAKSVDRNSIDPGETVTYTLVVRNDKAKDADGVTVVDEIPDGMTLDVSSIRGADDYEVNGNKVTFHLGSLEVEGRKTLIYQATSDPEATSTSVFFDGVEDDGFDVWETLSNGGNENWEQSDSTPFEGQYAWYLVNADIRQDQTLQFFEPVRVAGERPALRFFTKYETEPGFDAGIVQISTDGNNWENIDRKFLRHEYRGLTQQGNGATELFQGKPTFWGDSEGYQDVIVDLEAYRGQDIFVRWRFIADESLGERGWWIDNVEIMSDVLNYDTEVVVTTAEGDVARAKVGDLGVVVNSKLVSSVVDARLGETSVAVYPNPVSELLTVKVTTGHSGNATVDLLSIDGRRVFSRSLPLVAGDNAFKVPVSDLPAGMYSLRIKGAADIATRKVSVVH